MRKSETQDGRFLEELRSAGFLKMAEIQERFGVSQSTARRMCLSLEKTGRAIRGIGGVQYLPEQTGPSPDTLYSKFSASNMEEKERIAEYARTLVQDGDIIFISGGTTTALFAKRLAERLLSGELSNIVVVTNSFDCAGVLGAETEVVVTGGSYRALRHDMVGLICEKTLQKSRFNKAFLGVDGIDIENGLMTFDIDTSRVDRIVLDNSRYVYVLTDHTKFERNSFISYAHIQENCEILTDSGIPKELIERAAKYRVKLTAI